MAVFDDHLTFNESGSSRDNLRTTLELKKELLKYGRAKQLYADLTTDDSGRNIHEIVSRIASDINELERLLSDGDSQTAQKI